MSWDSIEEQEFRAKETEKRMIERIERFEESKMWADMFEGIRTTGNNYSIQLEISRKELKEFTEENAHLLI
jgi:uncharacterized protein (UPF0335 family)